MRTFLTIQICLLVVNVNLHSQITINSADMPNHNNNFIVSYANNINDYEGTGANYYWDFSELEFVNQEYTEYLHPISAPFSYNLVFIYPFVATICVKSNPPQIPQQAPITITDSYDFFKETSANFTKTGFAAKINDIPTPKLYDNPELYYTFPVAYGNPKDSSLSYFDIEIPGYGLFGQRIKRVNEVDGWGKILTPYGEFDCIRLKSSISTTDTIYLSQFGNGFNTPTRISTEYKWIAKNEGIPILQVNKENFNTTVVYKDSLRTEIVGIEDFKEKPLNIFPNPCKTELNFQVDLENKSDILVQIFNTEGKLYIDETIYHNSTHPKSYTIDISALKQGTYFVKTFDGKRFFTEKIVVIN